MRRRPRCRRRCRRVRSPQISHRPPPAPNTPPPARTTLARRPPPPPHSPAPERPCCRAPSRSPGREGGPQGAHASETPRAARACPPPASAPQTPRRSARNRPASPCSGAARRGSLELVLQGPQIRLVDPLFRIAAAAAHIAMHQHRRKIRPAQLNVVARAISPSLARHMDDVGALAFWADVCLFHLSRSFPAPGCSAAQRGRSFFNNTRTPRAWQSYPPQKSPAHARWRTMSLAFGLYCSQSRRSPQKNHPAHRTQGD